MSTCVYVCACVWSDCEAVSSTPAVCHEVNVSHVEGYREPIHHYTTCHHNMMEVEVVVTPTPRSEYSRLRLELGTLDTNNTPLAWIDFDRFPSLGAVSEWLVFSCVQNDVSRVANPWSITTLHTSKIILIQVRVSSPLFFIV